MSRTANIPAISVVKLSKSYINRQTKKNTEALRSIQLEIPRGSIFGLLGPNGAGKSTLINILAGTVTKTSGKVFICGHDLDLEPRAARLAIGVVPQELVLDPFFTVRETLDNFAGYYGVPTAKRRTQEIINALGLAKQADQPPRTLSGGMRRRLMVAKAMVHTPQVLILDEPTAGVDVELREQLWEYVRELHAQGTTIVLTTHYLEEAQSLCDRIAIIHQGSIIANESKDSLVQRFDRKRILFIFNTPLQKLPLGLDEFSPSIDSTGRLVVVCDPQQHPVGELLAVLQKQTLHVQDIITQEPDLEDAFRHVLQQLREAV
jgi:ABC-2 type transport system ATP-binding protein